MSPIPEERDDVTVLLERLNTGDTTALDELIPLVYRELRYQAARCLAGQDSHTLQPTALVHEAFLKAVGPTSTWESRRHFYNALAQVMRQILANHARAKAAVKRGGMLKRVDLSSVDPTTADDDPDWSALDVALDKLAAMDDRRYRVVMMKYFAGLTDAQVAEALGVSEKTVERDWSTARTFLYAELRRDSD